MEIHYYKDEKELLWSFNVNLLLDEHKLSVSSELLLYYSFYQRLKIKFSLSQI